MEVGARMLDTHKMMTVMGKGYQEQDNVQHATCNVQRHSAASSESSDDRNKRQQQLQQQQEQQQHPSVDSFKCMPQSDGESGLQPVVLVIRDLEIS